MCWARPACKDFLHSKNGLYTTLLTPYQSNIIIIMQITGHIYIHNTTIPYTLRFRTSGRDSVDVRVHNVKKAIVVQLQTWFKKE